MNSISYLDSVLTRSLTSSRPGSGSNTPAHQDKDAQRLNRRASDYSLTREREREKRRMAASLGLSSISTNDDSSGKRRSSKRSSRKGSDVEGAEVATTEKKASRDSRHPKAASEGNSSEGRARLYRTGSTPPQMRRTPSSSAAKWGGLWGLGGWLEGTQSYDSYARRERCDGRTTPLLIQELSAKANRSGRRASTSDADAALAGLSPEALLSERERENVVDFEGYDPDEDLDPSPGANAPPSTPYPTLPVTPTKEQPRQRQASISSTGSRISSLLFGALNPLTDDYFGPQHVTPPTSVRRRRTDDGSATESPNKRKRSKELAKEILASSEKNDLPLETDEKEGKAAKETQIIISAEAPPPYSDVASTASKTSLLLPSPDIDPIDGRNRIEGVSRRRRALAIVVRNIRAALDLLRRLVLFIMLGPARIVKVTLQRKDGSSHLAVETSAGDVQNQYIQRKFQTSSQAERPSAARHVAGRRKGRESRSDQPSDAADDSSSEELVTEEQAEARARRRMAATEKARLAEEEAAVEKKLVKADVTGLRSAGRLLPNPNPIDPLLAHDRDAKPLPEGASPTPTHLVERAKSTQLGATINRGPLSSLIHESPKVLVLDLDETLIHSTSRSPTWGALSDKSKGRHAVTAGGGLLGMEGLGGMMGLRGQVGVRPHQVEVVLDGRSIIYHVYKRPHVDYFLRKVAAWYHVVIFTASVQEYADPVIDWLDQGRSLVGTRLFRESCTFRNGSYLKNLAHVDADLSRVCLVDNSPASYLINQANGIPIEGWTHDPNDEALLDLLPVLDSLRFASDVRHILGLRGFLDSKRQGHNGVKRS